MGVASSSLNLRVSLLYTVEVKNILEPSILPSPSSTFYQVPWPSMNLFPECSPMFHDLPWPSITFQGVLMASMTFHGFLPTSKTPVNWQKIAKILGKICWGGPWEIYLLNYKTWELYEKKGWKTRKTVISQLHVRQHHPGILVYRPKVDSLYSLVLISQDFLFSCLPLCDTLSWISFDLTSLVPSTLFPLSLTVRS